LVLSKETEVIESLTASIVAHLDNPLEILRVCEFNNMEWDLSGKTYCTSLRKRILHEHRTEIDSSTSIPEAGAVQSSERLDEGLFVGKSKKRKGRLPAIYNIEN
jgi:hypothetical protein